MISIGSFSSKFTKKIPSLSIGAPGAPRRGVGRGRQESIWFGPDWSWTIPLIKQARKLERCATLRWNLRTAVKLAHSQNCRPQSRKKSKWNLCNCDCWKTCTETTANRRDGKNQRGYIQRSYSITQVGSTILPGRHRPFDKNMPRKRPFPSELF